MLVEKMGNFIDGEKHLVIKKVIMFLVNVELVIFNQGNEVKVVNIRVKVHLHLYDVNQLGMNLVKVNEKV